MKVHVQIGKLLDDLSVVFATNAKHILQSIWKKHTRYCVICLSMIVLGKIYWS